MLLVLGKETNHGLKWKAVPGKEFVWCLCLWVELCDTCYCSFLSSLSFAVWICWQNSCRSCQACGISYLFGWTVQELETIRSPEAYNLFSRVEESLGSLEWEGFSNPFTCTVALISLFMMILYYICRTPGWFMPVFFSLSLISWIGMSFPC